MSTGEADGRLPGDRTPPPPPPPTSAATPSTQHNQLNATPRAGTNMTYSTQNNNAGNYPVQNPVTYPGYYYGFGGQPAQVMTLVLHQLH